MRRSNQSKRIKPTKPVPSQKQTPSLLALPAELRNRIYEYVVGSPTKAMTLRYNTGLVRACRQIRREYQSILHHYIREEARRFRFTVKDFDFAPLQAFMNTLAAGLAREIQIDLECSAFDPQKYTVTKAVIDGLEAWDGFCTLNVVAQTATRKYYC